MQYSLRSKSSNNTSIPKTPSRNAISSPVSHEMGDAAAAKSITKKVSRTFTLSKTRKTTAGGPLAISSPRTPSSSAKSVHSDSDASSSKSSPSSLHDSSSQNGWYVRSSSPTSSISESSTIKHRSSGLSRQASVDSFMSTYTHGYDNGQYAVNLEELYMKEDEDTAEERLFAQKGLQKFTVQEYLAVL